VIEHDDRATRRAIKALDLPATYEVVVAPAGWPRTKPRALNIALHRADLFSVAMSFSGFIAADDPEADPGVFGDDPTYLAQNSPAALLRTQAAAGDIYYVLSGGQDDSYFQHRMAEFGAELDRLGIAHELHVVPGGHDGTAWGAGLDFGLAHLAAQSRAG